MLEKSYNRRQVLVGAASLGVLATFGPLLLSACQGQPTSSSQTGNTLAKLKTAKTMRVGFTNEAPYCFATADGNLSGIEPTVLRAWAATQGIDTLEGVLAPFPAMIPGLVADRFDAVTAGLYLRPARCEQVAFANPFMATTECIVVQRGNPLGIRSFADIASNTQVLVTLIPGGVEQILAEVAKIPTDREVLVQDVASEFAAMTAKRANALLTPTLSASAFLLENPDPSLEIVRLDPQPTDQNGLPFAGYPAIGFRFGDNDVVESFNGWLVTSANSGELLKLIEPFGVTQDLIDPALQVSATQLCKASASPAPSPS